MTKRSKIRRVLLGAAICTSLLLGGATAYQSAIHDPGVLYFAGQIQMAMGNVQGGLQLVSRAAAERDAQEARKSTNAESQTVEAAQEPATDRATQSPKATAKPSVAVASVAEGPATVASPDKLRLLGYEFPNFKWITKHEMEGLRRESAVRHPDYREQVRIAMLQVQDQLKRQNVIVPEQLVRPSELPPVPEFGPGASLP